ncbi:MAG: hypothetical protein HYU64_08215 [Armatimonadetes bacterium]|nr:hypothetical protein [Armatimonadota bacterium]
MAIDPQHTNAIDLTRNIKNADHLGITGGQNKEENETQGSDLYEVGAAIVPPELGFGDKLLKGLKELYHRTPFDIQGIRDTNELFDAAGKHVGPGEEGIQEYRDGIREPSIKTMPEEDPDRAKTARLNDLSKEFKAAGHEEMARKLRDEVDFILAEHATKSIFPHWDPKKRQDFINVSMGKAGQGDWRLDPKVIETFLTHEIKVIPKATTVTTPDGNSQDPHLADLKKATGLVQYMRDVEITPQTMETTKAFLQDRIAAYSGSKDPEDQLTADLMNTALANVKGAETFFARMGRAQVVSSLGAVYDFQPHDKKLDKFKEPVEQMGKAMKEHWGGEMSPDQALVELADTEKAVDSLKGLKEQMLAERERRAGAPPLLQEGIMLQIVSLRLAEKTAIKYRNFLQDVKDLETDQRFLVSQGQVSDKSIEAKFDV